MMSIALSDGDRATRSIVSHCVSRSVIVVAVAETH